MWWRRSWIGSETASCHPPTKYCFIAGCPVPHGPCCWCKLCEVMSASILTAPFEMSWRPKTEATRPITMTGWPSRSGGAFVLIGFTKSSVPASMPSPPIARFGLKLVWISPLSTAVTEISYASCTTEQTSFYLPRSFCDFRPFGLDGVASLAPNRDFVEGETDCYFHVYQRMTLESGAATSEILHGSFLAIHTRHCLDLSCFPRNHSVLARRR